MKNEEWRIEGEALTLVPLSLYLLVGVRVSEQIFVDLTVYDLPINSLPLTRWHTIGVPEGEILQCETSFRHHNSSFLFSNY